MGFWGYRQVLSACPTLSDSQTLHLDRLTWLLLRMRSVLPKRGILS